MPSSLLQPLVPEINKGNNDNHGNDNSNNNKSMKQTIKQINEQCTSTVYKQVNKDKGY